jgi:hypothetical protein
LATIAIGRALPDAVDAVLIRRVHMEPHDVIMIRESTSPQALEAAVHALGILRARDGDVPSRDGHAELHGMVAVANDNPVGAALERRRHSVALLIRLKSASSSTIPGIGDLRAVTIALAAKR